MHISLNLLDAAHRKMLNHERLMLVMKDITMMILGTVAFIAILLVVSRAALSNDLQEAVERANIVSTKNQPVQKAIRELNTELQGVSSIADEYTAWSHWFARLYTLISYGNQLTDLSISRQDLTLSVRGFSRTRNDLLLFKEGLESSGLVKELQFPLSNLLLRENIAFQFTATLNPEPL